MWNAINTGLLHAKIILSRNMDSVCATMPFTIPGSQKNSMNIISSEKCSTSCTQQQNHILTLVRFIKCHNAHAHSECRADQKKSSFISVVLLMAVYEGHKTRV